jgi:hypothetical protein
MRTNLNLNGGGGGFSKALDQARLDDELADISTASESYTSEQINDALDELDAIIADKERADAAAALLQLNQAGRRYKLRRYGKTRRRYDKTRRRYGKTRRRYGRTRRRYG